MPVTDVASVRALVLHVFVCALTTSTFTFVLQKREPFRGTPSPTSLQNGAKRQGMEWQRPSPKSSAGRRDWRRRRNWGSSGLCGWKSYSSVRYRWNRGTEGVGTYVWRAPTRGKLEPRPKVCLFGEFSFTSAIGRPRVSCVHVCLAKNLRRKD